jgi:diacylglycerol kinase (ATP)
MKNILLFFNPNAGTQEYTKETLLAEVEEIIPDGVKLTTYLLEDEFKKKEKIQEVLEEQDWDLVIIGGGDGTIKRVVKVMIDEDYHFDTAVLPLGSANGLSTCLGIDDLDDALEAIVEGKSIEMDVLTVNDDICLHLCDFGFNAGLVKKFDESDARGMMTYFKGSLAEIFENKPYHFQIQLNGELMDVEARMLLIANGQQFGTGAVINPTGEMDDGYFEVLAIKPEGLDEVISFSYQLLRGEPQKAEHCQSWKTKELLVKNPDEAVFQVDGDVEKDSAEVKVGVLKNRLRMIWLEKED